MSRELKFRAWGKNSHEYLGEGEGFNIDEMSWIKGQLDKWELEQYTGLKDKRGMEIYEGDLLKWKLGDYDQIMEVRWRQEECCFEVHFIKGHFGDSLLTDDSVIHYEVIGNIHDKNAMMKLKGQE